MTETYRTECINTPAAFRLFKIKARKNMFKNITLEVSLKPFKQTDNEYIHNVCRTVFRQWYPLLKDREEVSVMMWTADGSELLDYSGNMDDTFEWACYIGNANKPLSVTDDDMERSIHSKKKFYMKNPPVMTYKILKNIVAAFKEEGKKAFPDAKITVGETFDIGPEFAVSDFKYNRHREICGGSDAVGGFIDSTALIDGDNRRYAAYPNGIPDKTPFGLFLGKQANTFLTDMGFDYIWLSNGMGFSVNPWSQEGKIYDGENFHAEKLENVKNTVFDFWKLFRSGCPDFPVKTRGTNNSVGIDYASDGVPLYDIYNSKLNITPPPNSPWAALNDNFGLELMGHMTRICNLPGDNFMFRYYIHDPWWINSPWYDRYDSNPHDIYLPMAVSRIDENGKMQSAGILNILSIDNSFGNMPDCCVNEPLPHILKAEKHESDEVAPFVWVYPMHEYTSADTNDELRRMYFGDKFICDAINGGFPLNCVVSTDNFVKHPAKLYQKSILVVPALQNDGVTKKLREFSENGGNIIMYGEESEKHCADGIKNVLWADISSDSGALLRAADKLGYSIIHAYRTDGIKPPTMTVARHNNGMYFSVYNTNTTTETSLHFPLGAPIMMCGETEIKDGYSTYRFARSEHMECRIFVKQKDGIISVREATAACFKYRRRFKVSGLHDATVCYFSEEYSKTCAAVGPVSKTYNMTPALDERFKVVNDPKHGTYIKGEHITGDFFFFMPTRIDW